MKILILILLMLIYLVIYSHFSIVYNSFLISQNIQILAQSCQECISAYELNLEGLIASVCYIKASFFLSTSKESKKFNALQLPTIYYMKLRDFLLEY